MDIQVDPLKLVETSNNIKNTTAELRNIMDAIEMLILSVNGSWQGDAEVAFATKIIFVKQQFANIATFLDTYSDLLVDFSIAYEQQDDDLSSKISLT